MEGWIVAGVLYMLGVFNWVLEDLATGGGGWGDVLIGLFWPLIVLVGCLVGFVALLNDKLIRRL